MYVILILLIAVLIARCLVVVRRTINVAKASSDTVIELACDADKASLERETFAPETLQHLYDHYSSDHQPRTEADRHVDKLYKMLESKSLDFEGRLFLWREIWSIKHATNFERG